jgi:hypothetical protein
MNSPTSVGSLAITTGNSATIGLTGVTATGDGVSVGAGNGATIALEGVVSSTGSVSVSAGSNAASLSLDNVTALHGSVNVTAGDGATQIGVTNSTASTMNISNGNGNTFILLSNDFVGTNGADLGGGLNLTSGNGSNTLEMLGLDVLDGLFVTLGSGGATGNTVFAGNVVTDFGIVNGGTGPSNVYASLGGNAGYILMGFTGYFI